jgi:hypothetical protein
MDDNIKTGHNINAALKDTAKKISNEHNSLIALFETVEAKAKRIGELLIEIKPTIKDAGLSMTDFCRDHLPFGKSAAYEYIAIAQGKTTVVAQNERKNNSATAETFDPEKIGMDQAVEEALPTLRYMFNKQDDVDRSAQIAAGTAKSPSYESVLTSAVQSSGFNITKADWIMVEECIAQMIDDGVIDEKPASARECVRQAVYHINNSHGSYVQGYQMVCDIVELDQKRTEFVLAGNIKAAKDISAQQERYAAVVKMSLDTIRMLHQLMMNDDANMIGLSKGGSSSQHPLWEAYDELINLEILRGGAGGPAEDWCCEAMVHTWLRTDTMTPQRDEFIHSHYGQRSPFWYLATEAAKGHKQTLDAIAERVRANMDEARASKTECEAALAELKANDTEEDKAAYAKLLAETQPVLEILDDVLGED